MHQLSEWIVLIWFKAHFDRLFLIHIVLFSDFKLLFSFVGIEGVIYDRDLDLVEMWDHNQVGVSAWQDDQDVCVRLVRIDFTGEGLSFDQGHGDITSDNRQRTHDVLVIGVESNIVPAILTIELAMSIYLQFMRSPTNDDVIGVFITPVLSR